MNRVPYIEAIQDASIGYGFLPRWLCPWVRGPQWRLQEDYAFLLITPRCTSKCGAVVYVIPKGYVFNKASVPPLLWGPPFNYLPDGLCTVPSLEHDYLCDLLTGGSDWLLNELGSLPECPSASIVHEHFRLRLHQAGVRRSKAQAMGRAVAALGPQGWAWPWLKLLLISIPVFTLYTFFK